MGRKKKAPEGAPTQKVYEVRIRCLDEEVADSIFGQSPLVVMFQNPEDGKWQKRECNPDRESARRTLERMVDEIMHRLFVEPEEKKNKAMGDPPPHLNSH